MNSDIIFLSSKGQWQSARRYNWSKGNARFHSRQRKCVCRLAGQMKTRATHVSEYLFLYSFDRESVSHLHIVRIPPAPCAELEQRGGLPWEQQRQQPGGKLQRRSQPPHSIQRRDCPLRLKRRAQPQPISDLAKHTPTHIYIQ
eukprot:c39414_g1_i1 orf=606-1034(+)